jgi:hypothetical protein
MTESLWTCFSYLQVWSMHEIISTFDDPDSDMAYARLMCWGLFVGQSAECIVQAYSWCVYPRCRGMIELTTGRVRITSCICP